MIRAALLGLAAVAFASCAEAKPPVWIVRDSDSEMLLFGSVHVLPPGLDWRPPELEAALKVADDLWFELPIEPAAEAETGRLASERGVFGPGHSLSALLTPEGGARLTRATERAGLSPAVIDGLEPWFAEVVLAGAEYRRQGAVASSGVEKAVAEAAPAAVARRAFETPDQQIALFDQAPLADQVASLEQTLEELESRPNAYADLVGDWMSADLPALDRDVMAPLRTAAPGLYKRLVTDRNARWTVELDKRLRGKGRTVVVVGVGHLIGPDGAPARLRALGYSVEGP